MSMHPHTRRDPAYWDVGGEPPVETPRDDRPSGRDRHRRGREHGAGPPREHDRTLLAVVALVVLVLVVTGAILLLI